MAKMLEIEFPFKMMASSALVTNLDGNTCLDIGVNVKTDHVEDER